MDDAKRAWLAYSASEKRLRRCSDAGNDPTGFRIAEYARDRRFREWLVAEGLDDLLAASEPDDALPLEHAGVDAPLGTAALGHSR